VAAVYYDYSQKHGCRYCFFSYLLFTKARTDLVTKVLTYYSQRHGCRYFSFYFLLFTKACTDIVKTYLLLFTKAWMQVLPVWDKKKMSSIFCCFIMSRCNTSFPVRMLILFSFFICFIVSKCEAFLPVRKFRSVVACSHIKVRSVVACLHAAACSHAAGHALRNFFCFPFDLIFCFSKTKFVFCWNCYASFLVRMV
jgi:hypothetical protein